MSTASDGQNARPKHPTGVKLALIMSSVFVAVLLVSLVRSSAIPQITNEFKTATDIGWYGSAYLLTNCAFQLVFGRIYTLFALKPVLLVSILLFEAGSAICGAAPSSNVFIIGRAVAGLGSGGILSGAIVVVVYAVPLHNRPRYQGMFGAAFGVSALLGPLVGGAFTTNVSWRWCFYLNLPIGGVVMGLILLLFQFPHLHAGASLPLTEKLKRLNALSLLALVPGVVCLCLALQWGGTTYAWSNARIVALLVLAGVLLIAFILIQIWDPERATVPPSVFAQRSILSGFFASSCIGSHMTVYVFFFPLWFQAIKHTSAIGSGVGLLPIILPTVAAVVANGQLVTRIGYYTPPMIIGICVTAVGAGLLTTLKVHTSTGQRVGYQIVYGFGLGLCFQGPNMAAQTVLSEEHIAIGSSLMYFGQQLFGAVFISVGQSLLSNRLTGRLAAIPGIDPRMILKSGATDLLKHIPPRYHGAALEAYNDSLRLCFLVGLGLACTAIIGGATMEWRSVRSLLPPKTAEEKAERGANVPAPINRTESDATLVQSQSSMMTKQ